VVDSVSGSFRDGQYVRRQPRLREAPALTARLLTDTAEFDRVFRWDALDDPLVVSLRQQRERFTEGRHVHTTFAAALRYDYGLTDYRDARLDGETLRFFVEPAEVSVGGNDDTDSEEPLYGYYYWFALWELAEGVDPPSDLTVALRTPSEANYDRTPRPTATGTAIDTHTPTTDESE
jgi:hypothetical protein